MWSRGVLQTVRRGSSVRQAGVLFDVDGVLLRGRSVLPGARRALRKLLDQNNNFLFPVVFVTNAGSCQRRDKAEQLSNLLHVQIAPEQVVLSHSPLQMMKSFHDRCVLVCGQGPTSSIANTLGFQKVLSIEQLALQHPLLDMVDHQRKPTPPLVPEQSLPQIQAIILFGEPIKWETNLQLLIDVLLTNGRPGNVHDTQLLNQLPILACNMDLLWMAEAPSPRDNLMTDIYGANLYNRYLAQQHAAMTTAGQLVAGGTGSQVTMAEEEVVCAAQCRSILVCTGVYNPQSLLPGDQTSGGHRDLVLEADLVEPSHVVEDVEAAVDLLLEQESSVTSDL